MEFIPASAQYLEDLCRITDEAKAQLKGLGIDQWQKGYPNREVWERDIDAGCTWLAVEDGKLLGAYAYQTAPEPSYDEIHGAWLTDTPYASFHRVCVSDAAKGRGVAGALFAHGFALARTQGFASVRIDTHEGNLPMRRALEKAGFTLCGTIYLVGGSEDGDLRVAYEKILES